ncbi:MAG: hypothetical protein BWY75_03222 [bacterium ADurb.Bin425]|nr:MAG: hypothetical protein BWY75_03222 [bacterium ADurb.Bin425]
MICKTPIAIMILPQGLKSERTTTTIILSKPTQTKVHRLTSTKERTKPAVTLSVSGVAKKTKKIGANMYCAQSKAV